MDHAKGESLKVGFDGETVVIKESKVILRQNMPKTVVKSQEKRYYPVIKKNLTNNYLK